MIYILIYLKLFLNIGAVSQPASINIAFGCRQAHQYSKTQNLGFIRAVSWKAQNAERHWSHVHITLIVEHFSFHAFYKKCGLQRDLMSCSSSLTLQRRCIFFLHISIFEKSTNLFNATEHYACSATPIKISIDILLPAAKTFGLKLAEPTSQNNLNLFLLLVGGGCILSITPFWPQPTYPHRVAAGPYFEAWTRPEPEFTSPNPARARHLFLKPDVRPKAKFTQGVKICATAK